MVSGGILIMAQNNDAQQGFILNIVRRFITSQLSVIMIIVAFTLGAAAILVTPREEEPQIVVPLADVFVNVPGATPAEIEKLVATPLERMLWQIDGVEYVYSMSGNGMAVVTVRFYVGEDRENSLVKLHNKIRMNIDRVPPIVKGWIIKPVEIDDVPIVNLTLYSDSYNDHELRRTGEEVLARLSEVKNISRTDITGGRKREIRVELNPERMAGLGISIMEVGEALRGTDASVTAGSYTRFNREVTVSSNSFLNSAEEVKTLVVGVSQGRPVYLRDIAEVIDGPELVKSYTRIGFSNFFRQENESENYPELTSAVTLSVAKKKGTNAVKVSRDILKKLDTLKQNVIPDGVNVEVTRNYGQTAQEKVNGLLSSLAFAIVSVVILLAIVLGWREALVVALAVPISFSLALFVNYLFGYTINRVTLFALILSLGLVVDDPITNVDNIQRHILSGRFKNSIEAALFAVKEVLTPVLLSTVAIIVSFMPLFYITGMMGPYMAPMAINVPLTVIFSTLCALTIVPWLSYLLLRKLFPVGGVEKTDNGDIKDEETAIFRIYKKIASPFLDSRMKRYFLLGTVLLLLVISGALAVFRLVPLKLLPFDNKNEFQIVIDMPEGTPLEKTSAVVDDFQNYLKKVPEVTNYVSYVGIASPIDFNGLVRHYYLREGGNLADIQVNLASKDRRSQQSHAMVLRLRKDLMAIADKNGANIKLVEVPPGPPVLSTLVAEIYGDPDKNYSELIKAGEKIKKLMSEEPFVVDIDSSDETSREKIEITLDREKAALHGVTTMGVTQSLKAAIDGATVATLHLSDERQPLGVRIILPRDKRTGVLALSKIPVKTSGGDMVPLAELVHIDKTLENQPIYHKNLERVVFVYGEMAGRAPAEAVIDMGARLKGDPLPKGIKAVWSGEGEWKITIRVFRDMGIAFAAALLGIYILLVVQSGSYFMPVLIMMAIPLTLLGIMPGFYLLNLITGEWVGGYYNPVFFTATSMIGMIALGGIVIRNSLVLIEFIHDALAQGMPFREAILKSGAIRMRPILLTAATTALGAWPITLDPVFSGLAWALIFGLLASTVFTLLIVPVTYYALFKKKYLTE
jgi:multidrug efflux pump subunit AcrB